MISIEYHLNKNNNYNRISYGWDESYIQKRNFFGIKYWYDTYTNKKVSKEKEKELNRKR